MNKLCIGMHSLDLATFQTYYNYMSPEDRFGSSPEFDNLVSQLRSVNRQVFARYERRWASAVSKGAKVELKIQVLYGGDSFRTSGFKLDYNIDGELYETVIIPNN